MSVNDADGAAGAEKEVTTLEAEAAQLDELAASREAHAREERDDERVREDRIRADEEEIRKRQDHIRHERAEIARDEEEARHEDDEAKREREEAERIRNDIVKVEAIVAGKGVEIDATKDTTLSEIRAIALKESENLAQPPEKWEVKNEAGVVLDVSKTLADYGFCHEVKLWIDLKAGAAGDMQTVDPDVTRAKFDCELDIFRQRAADFRKRGVFLVSSEYPKATFLFSTTKTQPPTIATAVEIDFTDYDLRPLSVTFVDPFTNEPVPLKEQRFQMIRRSGPLIRDTLGNPHLVAQIPITQPDVLRDRAFICLAGVREYHDNPAHSGDSWLLHRASGEGSLSFILDKMWMYGTNEIEQFQIVLQPKVAGYMLNAEAVPE